MVEYWNLDWRTRFENIKPCVEPCVEPCTECDISVSKLLSFETFVKFLKVSVSVPGKIFLEKKIPFRRNLVSKKSLGFSFGQHFGLVQRPSKVSELHCGLCSWPFKQKTTNNKALSSTSWRDLFSFTLHTFTPPFCKLSWKKIESIGKWEKLSKIESCFTFEAPKTFHRPKFFFLV